MRRKKEDELDVAISDVLKRMRIVGPNDQEYRQLVTVLDRLMDMRNHREPRWSVSPDTLAIVIGNLIAVVIVTQHERAAVVSTKALDFLIKRK